MRNLVSNYLFNLLSYILNITFGLLLSVILARNLGATNMGHYSYLVWLMSSLALIFTLGLPKALTRFIALSEGSSEHINSTQLISRVLLFELKISLIVAIAAFVVLAFFNINDKTLYFIAILSVPFLILNNLLGAVLQGLQKFKLSSQVNLLILSGNLLFSILVLILGGGVKELLILNLFIAALTLLLSWYLLRKNIRLSAPMLDNKSYSQIFKYTASTSAIVFVDLIVLERSEILFLSFFSSVEQIAFYALAYGLVTRATSLLSGALSGVVMPKVAEYLSGDDLSPINTIYFHSTRFLIFIIAPMVAGGIVIADLLISVLYGVSYLPMVPALKILLISGGLVAIVAAASSVIYGIGKQNIILKIGILLTVLNLILDLVLIPGFHATGAAAATAIAQILGVFLGTFYIVYIKKLRFPWYPGLKVVVAAVSSGGIIFLIRNSWFVPSLIQIIALGLIFILSYLSILGVLKFFNKKDLFLWETAKNLLMKKD